MPNGIRSDDVGGLGEYPLFHCTTMFLSLSFFGLMGKHTGQTGGPILTIYTSYDVFPCKDVPFGGSGSVDIPPHLGVKYPKNHNFGSMNRHFQAKCTKYSNFHIIKTTAWIPTKFCTPVKTSKYALRVVQKCKKRNRDGGRPPSWKIKKNCNISTTTWPISMKFGMVMHLGWPPQLVYRHLQKWKKNCTISTTAWPVLMKFGTLMHLGPLQLVAC